MARVLKPRKVDARTKEVIAFAVAAITDCDFCINAHTMGLRRHGYDDEAIVEILGTVASPPSKRASATAASCPPGGP